MEKMDLVTCVAVVACVVLAVVILSKVDKCKCVSEKYDEAKCMSCMQGLQDNGTFGRCATTCGGFSNNLCFNKCVKDASDTYCSKVCDI